MAAFQRLAHGRDMTDALEREIRAATGKVDDRLHHLVAADRVRIDEIRYAEFLGHGAFVRVGVDADDLVGAGHARTLNDIEPDAAQSEHGDIGAWPHFRGVDHRADAGRDAAADVADLVKRRVRAHFGQRNLRQHREIRKRRTAHVVKHRIAVATEAAGAVGHHALALRRADRGAEIRAARQTRFALPAFRRVERDHMVAYFQRCHARARLAYDARAFVAENGREQSLRIGARQGVGVGVADAGCLNLDQHLAGLWPFDVDRLDFQGLAGFPSNCGTRLHQRILQLHFDLI